MVTRVILVDGDCALCNGFVRFISGRDSEGRIYFETQQSEHGQNLMKTHNQPLDLSTMIMFECKEACIRDFIYAKVAAYRYIIFGKTKACKLPDKVLRKRISRPLPRMIVDAVSGVTERGSASQEESVTKTS
ncbi:hypothetical protein CYMTET_4009 [Cymbomonas tetramitiformis]|uniref:YuxK n=1 Tax=Cymbomonas tetramitiformis TaxID=36881 RepID=A0AAE0H297_9CHLO|nr:hypothetical protein CYMTET_4009 [Cymbomonas tetramitiformis]